MEQVKFGYVNSGAAELALAEARQTFPVQTTSTVPLKITDDDVGHRVYIILPQGCTNEQAYQDFRSLAPLIISNLAFSRK